MKQPWTQGEFQLAYLRPCVHAYARAYMRTRVCHKHTIYRKNNNLEKCAGIGLDGFISKKINKNHYIKAKKDPGSCLEVANSTANPADFHPNWAGLAVLFSRQILNGSQDFFSLLYNIFCLFL